MTGLNLFITLWDVEWDLNLTANIELGEYMIFGYFLTKKTIDIKSQHFNNSTLKWFDKTLPELKWNNKCKQQVVYLFMDSKLRINRLDLSNAFITRDKEFYADLKDKEKKKKRKKTRRKNQIKIVTKAFLKIFTA